MKLRGVIRVAANRRVSLLPVICLRFTGCFRASCFHFFSPPYTQNWFFFFLFFFFRMIVGIAVREK